MTNPYTDTRNAIVDALAGVGVTVHRSSPPSVGGPCVAVLFPEGQWLGPMGTIDWHVACIVPTASGNDTATTNLEQLVHDTRQALWSAGIAPGDVFRPDHAEDLGALIARIPVNLRADCN